MSELNLTIDGLAVKSQPGLSLLLAARAHGIDIPTLCHHDDLKPEGHCRLCVVEIGAPGRTRLVNSCTYPVEEGLIVQTQSERVLASRRHGAGTAPGPGPGRRDHPANGRGPGRLRDPL